MAFFDAEQLQWAADGPDGLARWWVDLPDVSYRGKVLVEAGAEPEAIVRRLDRLATKLGYNVTAGRLYSPVDLSEREDRPGSTGR